MALEFEWDPNKELINVEKHGFDFKVAASVFTDPWLVELYDEKHSTFLEERYYAIGRIEGQLVVLIVVYTERNNAIRIISARKASKEEEEVYYASEIYS